MTLIEGHMPVTPTAGLPEWDTAPYDPSVLADPYDWWAALRSKGDVVHIPKYAVLAVGWYEVTRSTFSDHEIFVSSRRIGLEDFELGEPWRPPSIILVVDPPADTRTRKVMSRALSPKVVRGLENLFQERAMALVDAIVARGIVEAVSEIAEVYPTTAFPEAVGMKDVHVRHVVDYGSIVFNAVGPNNDLRRQAMSRVGEVSGWINAACARDRLTDSGLGAMIYAAADEGEIAENETAMLVRSFLSAGVDATVTGIGNALWAFSQYPAEWMRLRDDPSLARPAFDEVLRLTSPVHTFARTAAKDTELAGIPVTSGTKLLCALGAANMDPDKWGDPKVFRIDRRPSGHLAFCAGIHGCVGQNIARAELQAILNAFAGWVAEIKPSGTPVLRPNNAIHALGSLPLESIPA